MTAPSTSASPLVPGVSLCRGCCCGTPAKRPDTDHQAQRDRLVGLAEEGLVRWRETDCLGPCAQANVLIVHPTATARRGGARAVWLSRVGDGQLDDLVTWVSAGGPGRAEMPPALRAHRIPAHRG